MDSNRRAALKSAGSFGALGLAIAAGLMKPGQALAQQGAWNKAAFDTKTLAEAVRAMGGATPVESKEVQFVSPTPDIAENGAVVPVEVTSRIPNTQSISIVAEKNPFPLVATYDLANGAEGYASTRMKMGQTSNVRAIVKAGDKYFYAVKEVKVTIGGCGG